MPALYIITGANGAGKSTVGPDYLPAHIRRHCTVFDGDKLFLRKQRELWAAGITAIKEAKKLAFAFVEETFHSLVEAGLQNRPSLFTKGILPTRRRGTFQDVLKPTAIQFTSFILCLTIRSFPNCGWQTG